MIRPATLADRRAIMGVLDPWFEHYPLKKDQSRLFDTLTMAISSAQHFVWVAEDTDVKGVLIGLTSDNLWAQRKNCNVTAWLSKIPGDGAKLLREFRDFVKSRPAIKVAGFCPDIDVDPRALKLAGRIGFKRRGGAYVFT